MTTQLVSNDTVALLLSKDEVSEPEHAREIVLSLLSSEGLTPWDDMEVELFTSGEKALLIARRTYRLQDGYRFPDSEALIGAAISCRKPLPSRLVSYDGEYYLFVSRAEDEKLTDLCEFSMGEQLCPDLLAHISEHGKVLINGSAIGQLKNYFA